MFAERWVRWVDRHRVAILLVTVLVGAATAPIAVRLPVYGDLSHLLPPQARSVQDLRVLETRAQVFGTVIVAVESDDATKRLAAAHTIIDRLSALPKDQVLGINHDNGAAHRFAWNNRHLLVPRSDLEAIRDELQRKKARLNPLFVPLEDDPKAEPRAPGSAMSDLRDRLRGLKDRVDTTRAGAEKPAPLVSQDGRLQIVVVRTPFPSGDVSRNALVLDVIERAVGEARLLGGRSVQVGLTGDVVMAAAEHRALLGGMLLATVITVVIVAAGMLIFFRSLAAVGALLATLSWGAVVTFAFARWSVGHLNLATAFLAPIVVGNGINFGIILLARYLEARRQGREDDPVGALTVAVHGTFGGTLTAALTASVAYGSLLSTNFLGFRHFGAIGGVGMLLCWGATFLTLPAALLVLARRGLARGGPPPTRFGVWLDRLVPRRPIPVLYATILLLMASGFGAWRYLVDDPFESNFKNLRSNGPAVQDAQGWYTKLDRAFGRGISGGTVIALPSRQRAREVAARLRAVDVGKADGDRLFARVSVLDDLVPPDQDERSALLSEIRGLLTANVLEALDEGDRQLALELKPPRLLKPITDGDVPAELSWPFKEKDGTRGRLVIVSAGAGFDLWRMEDLGRFVQAFQKLALGSDVVVGGAAFVQYDIVQSLYRDGPRATALAALGAILVVVIVLRPGRPAVVTLVCGAAGVLLLLSLARLLRIRVNFLDFAALPITIGIGIDYAANLAARHSLETPGVARRIVMTTGPAVVLCSFTTAVGYASLMISENQGIHSFGLAALLGELTCIGCALVLAPALLDLGARTAPKRS